MVSRAGKDLLKNTIRSTDHHNKLIQEEGMWRQWEIEKGLTMMVTDDCIRNRMRMDNYKKGNGTRFKEVDTKKLQKQKEAARDSRRGNFWNRKLMEAEDNDPDRWGHSGYRELYPEEFRPPVSPSPPSHSYDSQDRSKSKRRHHSRKKHKSKEKRTKRPSHKKKRHKSIDSESSMSKIERKSNTESERNRSPSSDYSKSSSSKLSEDHQAADNKMCSSLSAISAKELARRREYLKRKLEEFSKDSSPDELVNQNDLKAPKRRNLADHNNMQKQSRPKKLQSQVVIEKRSSKSARHKPLS